MPLRDDVKEKKKKMNMRKALPLLVIASMMLSLIPSMMVSAAVTASLSVSTGTVGTKVTVSGTINSFNGHASIQIDANGDGDFLDANELLVASVAASGYSFSKEVTIPDCYQGARRIRVTDIEAGAPLVTADAFFTVETSFSITVNSATNYEGGGTSGPATTALKFSSTVKGAPQAWSTVVQYRVRINKPDGTLAIAPAFQTAALAETGFGLYTTPATDYTIAAQNPNLVTHGTYTALLDTTLDGGATYLNRAQRTFTIGLTDKTAYDRTETSYLMVYNGGAVAIDKIAVTPPGGVEGANLLGAPIAAGAWLAAPLNILGTTKTTTIGTYVVTCYNGATVVKTQTFTVNLATLKINALTYIQTSVNGLTANIQATPDVKRVQSVQLTFNVQYPTGTNLDNIDLTGLTVKVRYNSTTVATLTLGALTDYAGGTWTASWKVPKDAVLGKNYEFYIDASSITDAYGNVGPSKIYRTNGTAAMTPFFTVTKGVFYPAQPVLNFPASTNTIQRTLSAKALVDIRYADNTRMVSDDFKAVNGTIIGGGGPYSFTSTAADYSADAGLWVIKWKIPYNAAPAGGATYQFRINADDIEDKYGNTGNLQTAASAGTFGVAVATIAVANVAVDRTNVQSDEQITVTFTATYPSGDAVTTRAATFPKVDIVDAGGNIINAASNRASYDSATGKWKYVYILPTGSVSGTYNATVAANNVVDDAPAPNANTGPAAKKYANFEVSRVSLIDVLAASNAAEASADLAQTKADAAKVAADTAATKADAAATAAADAKTAATAAGTKADAAASAATAAGTAANAAKTSADAATAAATSAGTKADAAKTAADAAKTAADSAAAAANGLTTLVYAAIGASLIAALAAIVALMQISRKIA